MCSWLSAFLCWLLSVVVLGLCTRCGLTFNPVAPSQISCATCFKEDKRYHLQPNRHTNIASRSHCTSCNANQHYVGRLCVCVPFAEMDAGALPTLVQEVQLRSLCRIGCRLFCECSNRLFIIHHVVSLVRHTSFLPIE